MAIITILFASLLFVLNKSQDNLNNILVNTYVGLEGDSIDKIDMNDPSNREYYAESKADYEIYKYEVSNDCYYNWKSKILDDKGIEILTKAYLAEFDKDTELYEQYITLNKSISQISHETNGLLSRNVITRLLKSYKLFDNDNKHINQFK